jgi:hypothetical protein
MAKLPKGDEGDEEEGSEEGTPSDTPDADQAAGMHLALPCTLRCN